MPPVVAVVEAVSQPVAVIRDVAAVSELSARVPVLCGEAFAWMKGHPELDMHGLLVAVYRPGPAPDRLTIEVGVQVKMPFPGDGRVVCSATPAGPAATVVHLGPYERLNDAHEALKIWCAANRKSTGVHWEVYGHWTDDPAALRTDVFAQLA